VPQQQTAMVCSRIAHHYAGGESNSIPGFTPRAWPAARSPAPLATIATHCGRWFGDRKPFPYLQTQFDEQEGRFSPDGHWVAYVSNESGRDEIYVGDSFPQFVTIRATSLVNILRLCQSSWQEPALRA
jgi:WD40 repeat protein